MTNTAQQTNKPKVKMSTANKAPTTAVVAAPTPTASKPSVVERTYEAPASPPPLLVRILAQHRRHGTASEKAFAKSIEETLRSEAKRIHALDEFAASYKEHSEGAMSITVSRASNGKIIESPTLFSCHIDTCDSATTLSVNHDANALPPAKKLVYDPNFGHIMLDKGDPAACLGADDGVGVWIMLMMIKANRPGTYMFHRGEEVGCISAKAVRQKEKAWLDRFEVSVAFDRPNATEIITHQRGQRCASDKFAKALQKALSEHGIDLAPSDRGVFTDNAEYAGIIPEVVNLGVGYWGQHSKGETLDVTYAAALLDALLKVDFDALPVDRDPAVLESKHGQYGAMGYGSVAPKPAAFPASSYLAHQRQMDLELDKRLSKQADDHFRNGVNVDPFEDALASVDGASRDDIENLIAEDPEQTATVVMALMLENAALKARVDALKQLLGAL